MSSTICFSKLVPKRVDIQKPPYIIYSKRAMAIYEALDIRKERIDPRQSWQIT